MSDLEHDPTAPPIDPAPPPPQGPPLRPVGEAERIRALDVLRGFAIFGIFMVNIQFFCLPFMHAWGGPALADAAMNERLAQTVIKVFFEFKFISIFSLLFGIGLAMQLKRAEEAGRPFIPVYLRRMFVLAFFGLAHAIGLWYGDILFLYAVIGTAFLALVRLRVKTLVMLTAVFLLISVVMAGSCGSIQVFMIQAQAAESAGAEPSGTEADDAENVGTEDAAAADETAEPADEPDDEPDEEAEPLRGWAALKASQGDPMRDVWVEGEILAYRDGPFLDALAFRIPSYMFAMLAAAFGYGWAVLAMFCLGAALLKSGFFGPEGHAWQKRLCAGGLVVGLPLEVLVGVLSWLNEHQVNFAGVGIHVLHGLGAFALCLGYVGTITLLVNAGVLRPLFAGLAAVGRLALSNYLTQTIVATTLMYWYGLGWFNELSRPRMMLLVVGVYVVQIMVSLLWIRVFRFGPFEWLWRSLTYMRPQPLLRANHHRPGS